MLIGNFIGIEFLVNDEIQAVLQARRDAMQKGRTPDQIILTISHEFQEFEGWIYGMPIYHSDKLKRGEWVLSWR